MSKTRQKIVKKIVKNTVKKSSKKHPGTKGQIFEAMGPQSFLQVHTYNLKYGLIQQNYQKNIS